MTSNRALNRLKTQLQTALLLQEMDKAQMQ